MAAVGVAGTCRDVVATDKCTRDMLVRAGIDRRYSRTLVSKADDLHALVENLATTTVIG